MIDHDQAGQVRPAVADDNRRLVVPPGDADALSRGLAELVDDAALCARLGAANRSRCEQHYEKSACYGRYVELYERIATGMFGS